MIVDDLRKLVALLDTFPALAEAMQDSAGCHFCFSAPMQVDDAEAVVPTFTELVRQLATAGTVMKSRTTESAYGGGSVLKADVQIGKLLITLLDGEHSIVCEKVRTGDSILAQASS